MSMNVSINILFVAATQYAATFGLKNFQAIFSLRPEMSKELFNLSSELILRNRMTVHVFEVRLGKNITNIRYRMIQSKL